MGGVTDKNKPSDQAKFFMSLILKAGLKFKEITYGEPGGPVPMNDFDLFIGEKE